MALRNIHAFQNQFDAEVIRTTKDKLTISVKKGGSTKKYTIKDAASLLIKL
jgi:hypothetical protein